MKSNVYSTIVRPLITEKGTWQSDKFNAYTFEVCINANKAQIKLAIEEIYEVKVLDVRTCRRKGKPRRTGYRWGKTKGWKKAVVVLHPDNQIEMF